MRSVARRVWAGVLGVAVGSAGFLAAPAGPATALSAAGWCSPAVLFEIELASGCR